MALQLYVTHVNAKTEAAERFCKEFSLWMEASSVTDTHALDELFNMYCESELSAKDEFTIYFDGDYKTYVSSDEMNLMR